ncbi:MAG: hypothetical protein E7596_06200 [Ruminococcaceae bacterium]|nr:hypothetical protein [Oscillospiraceae bacterium]
MGTIANARKRISKHTVCEYKLIFSDSEYSIECTERDNFGRVTDYSLVKSITSLEEIAREMFQSIVKYGTCACTLYDIITDLIC